jgi:hypothetical protein
MSQTFADSGIPFLSSRFTSCRSCGHWDSVQVKRQR